LPAAIDDDYFTALTVASRDLHGHMFVLPVAVWMAEEDRSVASVSEVLRGLGGRLDRHRIIEAFARLDSIGAIEEMPRLGPRNSPRTFVRIADSRYWQFALDYARERALVGN
jgi:hypothetical protein